MNKVSKLIVFCLAASGVLIANAEIDGSGFYGEECEGTITTVFLERVLHSNHNEDTGIGVEDVKVAISLVDAPELGLSMLSSDESGRVEFTNLCPGTYRVEIGAESLPDYLVFGGVTEVASGLEIWDEIDRLIPLELEVAGVRNPETMMDFELWYSFTSTPCEDTSRAECRLELSSSVITDK